MTSPKKIGIIGAGLAGIASVKTCVEYGFEPVCFEEKDYEGYEVYGTIYQRQKNLMTHNRAYLGLSQNTAKTHYVYSDFPPFQHHAYYMRPHETKEYLSAYVDHFKIRRHFRFGRYVTCANRAKNYSETGKWDITTVDAKTREDERTETFDAVFFATGLICTQKCPSPFQTKRISKEIYHIPLIFGMDPFTKTKQF